MLMVVLLSDRYGFYVRAEQQQNSLLLISFHPSGKFFKYEGCNNYFYNQVICLHIDKSYYSLFQL